MGCRTNSWNCGSSIGPTLLVPFGVKAKSMHVIAGVWHEPIGTTISKMPQLRSHIHIVLTLQIEAGYVIVLFAELVISNKKYELQNDQTFCLNQEIKSGDPRPAPFLRRVSTCCGVAALLPRQNWWVNSLYEREQNRGGWMQNIDDTTLQITEN